jgi:hypothetical protein
MVMTAAAVAADPWQQSPDTCGDNCMGEGQYYSLGVVLGTANAVLCGVLILLYAQIWRKTRSEFSIGLIILSMALLLHSIVSNPWFHDVCGYRGQGLGPFSVLPQVFTTLALAVLVYLASR